jgi:hypothetical protein
LFATGDVASARLLYERAADAGVARAAVRLAETFDPVSSGLPHLRSLRGDSGTAVFCYRRARDLGATGVDEIERRRRTYCAGRPLLEITGRTAIVVDDGIATGATMQVAIRIRGGFAFDPTPIPN